MKIAAGISTLILILIICSCDRTDKDPPEDFGPPLARLNIYPTVGDSTTLFTLSAVGSRDADKIRQLLLYRWDLNGDSIWDTDYSDYPYRIELYRDTGTHEIRVEVTDRYGQTSVAADKCYTYGAIIDTSSFTDSRDGQVYKSVKLGELLWMAQNLNYGTMIPVRDSVFDDDIVHKYCYLDDSTIRGNLGGAYTFYDWEEAKNHDTLSIQGICPNGWELPTRADWETIISSGNEYLVKYYIEGGFSNLNLTCIGIQPALQEWLTIDASPFTSYWVYFTGEYINDFWGGEDQTTPYVASSKLPKYRGYIYSMRFANDSVRKYGGIAPIRCVKRD